MGARVGCVYWGEVGLGMRACNGNLAVLAQVLIEGKWSHVL